MSTSRRLTGLVLCVAAITIAAPTAASSPSPGPNAISPIASADPAIATLGA